MKKKADIMSKAGKWLLVFGIIFSQLSFPLNVLAEELNNGNTEEPIITINGEKTSNYTITDNTEVEVVLEYQGNKEINKFDFNEKLYGTYEYTFSQVDETITINYNGNNADLLNQYKKETDTLKQLVCTNESGCIINGFGNNKLTVEDITTNYYDIEAFSNKYNATVSVLNGEEILLETDSVINGYNFNITDNQTDQILTNKTPSTLYQINRVGDMVPEEGIIDTLDQEEILNDILQENALTPNNDINQDGVLNILDVTHSTFINNPITEEVTDILTVTINKNTDNILIGEEIEITLLMNGFDQQSLYGLEGLLNYDNTVLKLVNATYVDANTLDLGYVNLNNNKFAYILDGFKDGTIPVVTLKFKALSASTTDITINNIIATYGEKFNLESDSVSTSITILDPADSKGGDIEDIIAESKVRETKVIQTNNTITLSNDYYIKNLVISGYEIDFDMYVYEYSIKVGNDVDSLDLDILLNNNASIYYIEGNKNFKPGENTVSIVVKAENGSTKTYTITVEKEDKKVQVTEVEEEKEEKNTSKTIIIILIILVIIGLIYVIFKDDEEDEKEIKNKNNSEKLNKTKKTSISKNTKESLNKKKNKK